MDEMPSANGSTGAPHGFAAVHRDQRGAVITTYALRIVLVFVLVILAVEEVGQVINASIHASNAAGAAAQAGADSYAVNKNPNKAEADAVAALRADDPNAWMVSFSVAPDGTCTVTAYERANTLFIQRLPYLKKFQVQHATESEIHTIANSH
jgi:Flp pilus assembly protein TadG